MKRTIIVHSSNEMYGSDRMVLEVLKSVPAARRESTLVWLPSGTPEPPNALHHKIQQAGFDTAFVPLPILRRSSLNLSGVASLVCNSVRTAARLLRARPHTVYCATSATLMVAALARLLGVRHVIFHNQEIWGAGIEGGVLRALARSATGIVAISEASRQSLGYALGSRAVTVTNGVPDPYPGAAPRPIAARSGPLTFLVASRWNGWKGHATLLAAWESAPPGSKLRIAGGPPLSGESVDVRSLVSELSVPGSVEIVGEVANISRLVAESDVIIVPSDAPEPFGLVAVEAFAGARPVIASDAGGLADIVDDGETGLLFPPGDARALAALLRITRQSAAAMGEKARTKFETDYSSQRFQERFKSVWPD